MRGGAPGPQRTFLTVCAAGETFGLPIGRVQTTFHLGPMTRVPLGPPTVLGLVNLRGVIIPALSLRRLLGLGDAGGPTGAPVVSLDCDPWVYALVVDAVGEVVTLDPFQEVPMPPHVDQRRAALITGVYHLDSGLLPVLDIDALLAPPDAAAPVPPLFDLPNRSGRPSALSTHSNGADP